jgi:hypothetical protein
MNEVLDFDLVTILVNLVVAILLFVNLIGFGFGLLGGVTDANACRNYPSTRLAYLTPAFKVGCFLTE